MRRLKDADYYGRPMSCPLCRACFESPDPKHKGQCIYGGPFTGFRGEQTDAEVAMYRAEFYRPRATAPNRA